MRSEPAEVSANEVSTVIRSYARCRERGGFIEAFYRQLWARDPEIRERFQSADMDRQHEVMREAINTLLMFARGSEVAKLALDRLGAAHSAEGHAVHDAMYKLFIDVIVETAKAWDPQWSEELEPAWRASLEPGIRHMAAMYE